MDSPAKISASTLADHSHDHLSTPTLSPYSASSHTTEGRPASPRPSISSMQSGKTDVVYDSDIHLPTKKRTGHKVISSDVEVKITYWESLKSVFMPWQNKTRKVTAEIQLVDADEEDREEMEHFCSPWIPSVWVLSREKDSDNRFVQKPAQCTIDTANLQGNLVSRDFLLSELGFREADFMKLKKSHKHGVSVSGHAVIPDGTVKLTWYHGNSPRVFREMTFLVVPNPLCELVLGAQVIQKYGILNPPNFLNGVVHVDDTKDPKYVSLNKIKSELEEGVTDLELRIGKETKVDPKSQKLKNLKAQKDEKEKEFAKAKKEFDDYVDLLNKKRAEAEAQKKNAPANRTRQAPSGPQITITGVKGPSRSTTGFSIRTTSTTRSTKKG